MTTAPPREPDDALRRGPVEALRRGPAWLAPLLVGAAALVGCVVLALVDPETRSRFSPACPFRAVTGLDCPGCGATRAVHALVQGDVTRALDHNVLTVTVLLPLVAWGWWRWVAVSVGWRTRGAAAPSVALAWTLAALVGAFWVVRNVPVGPLAWLGSGAA